MSRKLLLSILAVVFASLNSVSAAPMIGLDMDPTMPGIQTTLSTTTSSTYTVDLVAYDDGTVISPLLVDTVAVDVASTGAITTFLGATAGAFVGGAPGMTGAVDLASALPILPGAMLMPGGAPGLTGGLSYSTFISGGLPGLLTLSPAGTAFDVLMSLTFSADVVGTTSLSVTDLISGGTSATGALSYFPAPLPPPGFLGATSFVSTLTITSSAPPPPGIPEPATLLLVGLGLLATRRKQH